MVWAPHLLVLPSSLLLLITSLSSPASLQGLYPHRDLPQDAKYFPEHEYFARRDLDIQQRIQRERPVAIRKMSGDAGEKFYLSDWTFASDLSWSNPSLLNPFENAFQFHGGRTSSSSSFPRYLDPRRIFQKRDYQCPVGTYACTSINRSNSCCSTDSTCALIENTGYGDVGCCPAGQTCAGTVTGCQSGYTSCSNDLGGGCCLPGYGCFDVGCVQTDYSTLVVAPSTIAPASTVTVTSTVWTTPSGGAPVIHTSTYTTIVPPVVAPPSTSTYIPPPTSPTTTVIRTTSTTTTRSPTSTYSYACPTDFRSCPASLGGGCCHTDRACGSGSQCPATTASTNYVPPARPTDVTTTSSTSVSYSGCPTGFYACSAYYEGGCCQVDRNCDKTSCPARPSTTLVGTNSVTAVAPTGSGITAPGNLLTGNCAQGWSTCASSVGGGCCPTGYGCGATACSATASGGGGSQIGKQAPSSAPLSRAVDVGVMVTVLCISSIALGLSVWL